MTKTYGAVSVLLLMSIAVLTGCLNRFIDSRIFQPTSAMETDPGKVGLEYDEISLESADGVELFGWWVPAAESQAIVLYCHGNAGNISNLVTRIEDLVGLGVSVFVFDYRGYGRSAGRPTEKGLYLDVEAAYRFARDRADSEGLELVVYGRSLGGIAAAHVAAMQGCDGLILESTFTNMGEMARHYLPLRAIEVMFRKRLNGIENLRRVDAPVLVIHGDRDEVVPTKLGRRLYDAARQPKTYVEIAGAGHNDVYQLGRTTILDELKAFLAR